MRKSPPCNGRTWLTVNGAFAPKPERSTMLRSCDCRNWSSTLSMRNHPSQAIRMCLQAMHDGDTDQRQRHTSTAGRGRRPNSDDKLPDLPHWTLHDLRRTARSLLSRERVAFEIAEKVLGHSLRGVAKVWSHIMRRKRRLSRKKEGAKIGSSTYNGSLPIEGAPNMTKQTPTARF